MANNVVKIDRPAPRKRIAHKGGYGAVPYDKVANHAAALLSAVKNELHLVDYFTREDLLHLDVLDHLSTISRYGYICRAARFLIEDGSFSEISNTNLCLRGRESKFSLDVPIHHLYRDAVTRAVGKLGRDQLFSVMDVVRTWKADPHLTEHTKRVIVRRGLAERVRDGRVVQKDEQHYYVEE